MVFLFHSFSFMNLKLFRLELWLSKTIERLIDWSQQTVIELVARRPCFLIVVCCSTRNDLDSLCSPLPFVFCSALSQTHFLPRNLHALQCFPNSLLFPPFPFPTCQYSDLGEDERAFILKKFRQVTSRWSTEWGWAISYDNCNRRLPSSSCFWRISFERPSSH